MPDDIKVNRRAGGLSRGQIIAAAIEVLDETGEEGLTFRVLASRLATGPGTLYWHIANKEDLLAEAADVMVRALPAPMGAPAEAIPQIALWVYDLLDAHPWLGGPLTRTPPPLALLRLYEALGRQLQALQVAPDRQFTGATLLGSYILSESRQNAANRAIGQDRTTFLDEVAASWQALDATDFAFIRSLSARLSSHDDRAEFLGGIALILNGLR
ncbi:TetR family transcriptional regulator [Rhodobacter sp. KR11]|uniref:TetR family transcriptional regulator n=1 Tax=Rhodobacter sp. KR11 TaxID=2974588 RepID=UPI00222343A3|nr:TetR/AcrR family transcriptional regulator [Rhodobacter sp. KR11]MCW1919900.1 TetR family transcriptional regulator [Rhodobacter sp. KR11]